MRATISRLQACISSPTSVSSADSASSDREQSDPRGSDAPGPRGEVAAADEAALANTAKKALPGLIVRRTQAPYRRAGNWVKPTRTVYGSVPGAYMRVVATSNDPVR